ncbi:MAG: TRAP transporter small permease [Pseudomonadota bacterium]
MTSSPYDLVDRIEENLIALLLGLMTLITFANVVARYVFNSNILWGLEATVFLFAWLVLLGVSYGVKHSLHLGVDVVTDLLPPRTKKIFALAAVSACLLFSIMLLKGCWDYWYPFATKRAFLETDDVPMPDFLQFMAEWLNEGERYEKMPRFIPYLVLPLSMVLLTYRYCQVAIKIIRGETMTLIASHGADHASDAKEGEN